MRRRSAVGGALEMFSLPLPLTLPNRNAPKSCNTVTNYTIDYFYIGGAAAECISSLKYLGHV